MKTAVIRTSLMSCLQQTSRFSAILRVTGWIWLDRFPGQAGQNARSDEFLAVSASTSSSARVCSLSWLVTDVLLGFVVTFFSAASLF